jgi:hypothetical protein
MWRSEAGGVHTHPAQPGLRRESEPHDAAHEHSPRPHDDGDSQHWHALFQSTLALVHFEGAAVLYGFPVVPEVMDACANTECVFSPGVVAPETRSINSMRRQSGNSIHVNMIGGFQTALLLPCPRWGEGRALARAQRRLSSLHRLRHPCHHRLRLLRAPLPWLRFSARLHLRQLCKLLCKPWTARPPSAGVSHRFCAKNSPTYIFTTSTSSFTH